jgi:hypothetical protein
MLQTIREYGLEQLRKSRTDAETYRTHAKHFASMVEEAEERGLAPTKAFGQHALRPNRATPCRVRMVIR